MNDTTRWCNECGARLKEIQGDRCDDCYAAWAWLEENVDDELQARWQRFAAMLLDDIEERFGADRRAGLEAYLRYLQIVSWDDRVATIAGWKPVRSWFARRYIDPAKAILQTDQDPVLIAPKQARRLLERKEQ